MRVVVLGSGTCFPAAPGSEERLPPLFALDVSKPGAAPRWLVFDCSEGARWRLRRAGIPGVDVAHVAVTHPHADHAALPQFVQGRACEATHDRDHDWSLTLYLPAPSAASLDALWAWHQPEDGGRATSRFALRVVGVRSGFAAEPWPGVRLRAFDVHHGHGRNPAVAYRVESPAGVFAYSGDTGVCDGVRDAARDATLFVCEASARVGVEMNEYGHLTPRQAGRLAAEANVARLVLTHYAGADPDTAMLTDARRGADELATARALEISIAHDGDAFSF